MTKTIALLSHDNNLSDNSRITDSIKEYFQNTDIEVYETDSLIEASESDLCVLLGYEGHLNSEILNCTRFIKIHPSLLPAFDCENAAEASFNAGVKVSGVTVNYINDDGSNGKIIAQYPVFIDYTTTLHEFEEEIIKVCQKLTPFVIESVLNDTIFSFDMLLKPRDCGGTCSNGGCTGCNKPCGSDF